MPGVTRAMSEPNFSLSGTAVDFHNKIDFLRNSSRRSRPGSAAYLHDADLTPAVSRRSAVPVSDNTNRSRAQSWKSSKSDLSDVVPRSNRTDLLRKRLTSSQSQKSLLSSAETTFAEPIKRTAVAPKLQTNSPASSKKPRKISTSLRSEPLRAFESPLDSDRLNDDFGWSRPAATANVYDFLPSPPDHYQTPIKPPTARRPQDFPTDVTPSSPSALQSLFTAGDLRSRLKLQPHDQDIDNRLATLKQELEELRRGRVVTPLHLVDSDRIATPQQQRQDDMVTSLYHRYFLPDPKINSGNAAEVKRSETVDTPKESPQRVPRERFDQTPDRINSYRQQIGLTAEPSAPLHTNTLELLQSQREEEPLPMPLNIPYANLSGSGNGKPDSFASSELFVERKSLITDVSSPAEPELSQLFGLNPRRTIFTRPPAVADVQLSSDRSVSTAVGDKIHSIVSSPPSTVRSYSHFNKPAESGESESAKKVVSAQEMELLRTETADVKGNNFNGRLIDESWVRRPSAPGSTAKPDEIRSQQSHASKPKETPNGTERKSSRQSVTDRKSLRSEKISGRKSAGSSSSLGKEGGRREELVESLLGEQKYQDILTYLNHIQDADADRMSQISGVRDGQSGREMNVGEESSTPATLRSATLSISLVEKMFLEKRVLTDICAQLLQQMKTTAETLAQMDLKQQRYFDANPTVTAPQPVDVNVVNTKPEMVRCGVDIECQTDPTATLSVAVQSEEPEQTDVTCVSTGVVEQKETEAKSDEDASANLPEKTVPVESCDDAISSPTVPPSVLNDQIPVGSQADPQLTPISHSTESPKVVEDRTEGQEEILPSIPTSTAEEPTQPDLIHSEKKEADDVAHDVHPDAILSELSLSTNSPADT